VKEEDKWRYIIVDRMGHMNVGVCIYIESEIESLMVMIAPGLF